jgi:hypothetical protein
MVGCFPPTITGTTLQIQPDRSKEAVYETNQGEITLVRILCISMYCYELL